jgi:hypothetical protein
LIERTAEMLRVDLEAAGIQYETASGVADFHALRSAFISQLYRARPLVSHLWIAAFGCRCLGFSRFQRGAFVWLGHPLVKCRGIARTCRNLNRFLYFYDFAAFIEIGFVRAILADFGDAAHQIRLLLRSVWIDHVGPLETVVPAVSRLAKERQLS